jgi:hypothetical protein
MSRMLLLGLATLTALAACKKPEAPPAPAASAPAATPEPTQAAAAPHAFSPKIEAGDFGELVKTLSSDAFEGRGPGTPGEDRTVAYITEQMQRIGLKPGNGDSWTQDVPMVETTADPSTALTITEANGSTQTLAFGDQMVIGTRTGKPEIDVKDSELVFVGYGVDAPERKWNDYAGTKSWKGKTVVMFVNDPGFHTHDEKLFDGNRMTYYGRWTYKFEEAARKGADAAIIIHDSEGASYGWDVVKNSWSGTQYDLPAADDPQPRIPAQGWITGEVARALFAKAGLDLDQAYKDASRPGFKPVPLKARVSGRGRAVHGPLGPPGQARQRGRRQHLQRRGGQRHRRGRHPGGGRCLRAPGAETEALGRVPGGNAGGVGPAGLEVLRRPSDLPAEQDRRGDQHRCDVGGGQGARCHRDRHGRLAAGGPPQAAGRRAGPHAACRSLAAERLVLPLGSLQLRQGRRAGAVRGRR